MYKEKDQKEVKEKGDGRPTRNWRMLEEKIEVEKKSDTECRGGMADCSRRRECMNSRFEPHYVTEIFLSLPSGV